MTKRSFSRLALLVLTAALVLTTGLQPPPAHAGEQLVCTIASPAFLQAPEQPADAAMAPSPKADAGLVSISRQLPKAHESMMPPSCEWFCTPCESCSSDCQHYECGVVGACQENSAECGSFNAMCTCY